MTISNFVKNIGNEEKELYILHELLQECVHECENLNKKNLPPLNLINTIGSNNITHFKSVMISLFQELVQRFKLNASSNVLDVGCGCGRLAIPFNMYLKNGIYYGVDVWEDGIDWCKKNIHGTNNGKTNFIKLESSNNYYFDKFNNMVNNYNLSEINESFDLIFAISTFTHLLKKDATDYLRSIRKLIKPNGCIYITCFIIDEYFYKFSNETGKHTNLLQKEDGCFYGYEKQDFFCGYTPSIFEEMVTSCGFKIVSYEIGNWAKKPGSRTYQDTFVLIPN